jgi:bifunctional DNA-binding transcriptional regulator/antitoxin component of YhaV-PrlF toxin-antitoxin module
VEGDSLRARIDKQGRVLIPAAARQAAGLENDRDVILEVKEGEVRISSILAGVRRAQAIVARYKQDDRLLSEELIAERRREGTRD